MEFEHQAALVEKERKPRMTTPLARAAKIGSKELVALLTLFVVTNVFLTYPQYISHSGLEASWMEPLISGVVTIILFVIVDGVLARHFYGINIDEIAKRSFGRVVGVLCALVFTLYFLALTASLMRQFTENVVTTVLPTTPMLLVVTLFILAAWYVAFTGLEGIARVSLFMLPVVLIGVIGVCVLTVNWWQPYLLAPVWGSGPDRVLLGGLQYSSIFANVLLLCIIYPHAEKPHHLRWVGVSSICLATVVFVLFLVAYHMVFTVADANSSTFPLYQMARMVYLGRFFQRIESALVLVWVASAVLKMALCLWAAGYVLAASFRWPTERPILPALALISFSISLYPENVMSVIELDRRYIQSWGWLVDFGLPLLIVLVGAVRDRSARRGDGRGDAGRLRGGRLSRG